MYHRLIGRAFALALAAGCLTAGQTRAGDCNGRPCVNVGAFNIKLLGTGGPANTPAEYREIGRLLAVTMDLDAFALEEINVRSEQWRDLRQELEARGYAIAFESAFGGERDQHIVVVYRRSAIQLVDPVPRDLPFATVYSEQGTNCAYDNIRPPVAASFRAGSFDFRLIGVHLKSQLPVGSDRRCDDRIRSNQASLIADYIGDLAGDEPDVIVVGDFNSSFPAPENDPLRNTGLRSAMEDRSPGSGDISFVNSPRGLIDQIVFRRDDGSYVRNSGYVYNLTPADRRFFVSSISDHVPIRASFYTDGDDD